MKVLIRYCFIFLFILISLNSNAQTLTKNEIDSIYKHKVSEKVKILLLNEILSDSSNEIREEVTAHIYHTLGKVYFKSQKYNQAILPTKKAIALKKTFQKPDLFELNKSRSNLFFIYDAISDFEKGYLTNLEIIASRGEDLYTLRALKYAAKFEREKGDYFKSLQHLNTALSNPKLNNSQEEDLFIRGEILNTTSSKYETIEYASKDSTDLKIAIEHFSVIEKASNEYDDFENNLAIAYNNMALIYDSYGLLELAKEFYLKAIKYFDSSENDQKSFQILNNLAVIYAKQGNYNKAEKLFLKVINRSEDFKLVGEAYWNLAYYLPTNQTSDKIPIYQKAIYTLLELPVPELLSQLPDWKAILDYEDKADLMELLTDMSTHLVGAYKQEEKISYLENALKALHLADQLVSLIRYESTNQQSKLFWINKGVDTYLLSVEVAYLLNLPQEAFYFMEKNKALLLQEDILNLQKKAALSIPDSVVTRAYQLQYQFQSLNEELSQNPEDTELRETYTNFSKDYSYFNDSLKQNYPEYAKVNSQVEIAGLKDMIQFSKANDQIWVEYILNDSDGYGILGIADGIRFFRISDVPELVASLNELKKLMPKKLLNKEQISLLQKTSISVFKQLFPFENSLKILANKKLVIIPDYTLRNFPLEALSTNATQPIHNSYLVYNTEISYLQSFSTFQQISKKVSQPNGKILGIAPVSFNHSELESLETSKEAIQSIDQFSGSKTLLNNDATSENFFKYAGEYEIIHLNTHAGINAGNEMPWIAFKNKKITLNELYGLEIHADLVVLDACKTNIGEEVLGEGILNLSRGFFHNGAQSVLASNWNINEKSGKEILDLFYLNLSEGMSKSKALQMAKIEFLKTHELSETLPYHWAGFTLTGNIAPVQLDNKSYWWIYALICFFIAGIIVFLIRKRK